MILFHTDMRTLLTSCQRVCRDWRYLITKSPSIQKALFFAPIKESEWGVGEIVHNTLLAEMFPTSFPANGDQERRDFSFSNCAMAKDPASLDRFVRKGASWRMMLVQQPPILELGLFHIDHNKGGDSASRISIPVSLVTHLILSFFRLTRCIQANPKKQAHGGEGLRMGRLFDILLFDSTFRYGKSKSTRLCWSTNKPTDIRFRKDIHQNAFCRMLDQLGLVLYTRQVIQCTGPRGNFISDKTTEQDEIIKAYKEHGLDIHSQEEEIKAYRMSAAKGIKCSYWDSKSDEGDPEERN